MGCSAPCAACGIKLCAVRPASLRRFKQVLHQSQACAPCRFCPAVYSPHYGDAYMSSCKPAQKNLSPTNNALDFVDHLNLKQVSARNAFKHTWFCQKSVHARLPLSLEGQRVIKATAKASMPTWPADDMQEHMACQSDDMLRGVT